MRIIQRRPIRIKPSSNANFSPLSIKDNYVWLRADLGITTVSGKVSNWHDMSGFGHDVSQVTSTIRPIYVSNSDVNRPYLDCGIGGATQLVFPNNIFTSLSQAELFFVASHNQQPTTNGNGGIYTITAGGLYGGSHIPFSDNQIYEGFGRTVRIEGAFNVTGNTAFSPGKTFCWNVSAGSNYEIRLNNLVRYSNNAYTFGISSTTYILNTSQGNLFGKCYELIIFSRVLSVVERAIIYNYIRTRYQIM